MPRLRIDPYAFFVAACALLVLPLDWFLAAVIAAACHELCHMLSICITGRKILGLSVGVCGATMEISEMSRGEELLCAAAGPIGSLCLLLLGRWAPKLAVCGFVQGIFNLLPLFPLDGGRIIKCLVSEKAYGFIQRAFFTAAFFSVIILCKYTVLPFLFFSIVILRLMVRKIPCKEAK